MLTLMLTLTGLSGEDSRTETSQKRLRRRTIRVLTPNVESHQMLFDQGEGYGIYLSIIYWGRGRIVNVL